MRYPIDEARRNALQMAFGNVEIIIASEFRFGDDPVSELLELVKHFNNVVAIELVAPPEILSKIITAKNLFGGAIFLKAEFVRGNTGRPTALGQRPTTGEDVLLFDHYVVLEEVKYVTSPLKKLG